MTPRRHPRLPRWPNVGVDRHDVAVASRFVGTGCPRARTPTAEIPMAELGLPPSAEGHRGQVLAGGRR